MDKGLYWIGLSLIKGLGPIRISKLINHFTSAERVWQASGEELSKVLGPKVAQKFVQQRGKIDFLALQEELTAKNISYLTLEDQKYPYTLKNIYDPPPVIFYQGQNLLNEEAVAIVGSRNATNYGRKVAEELSYQLSQHNLVIISGLARGIDSSSHWGALRSKGKTIAVLGSGLDIIYPPENKELFGTIREKGMLISEFPPGTPPLPANFPQRNRIISGLSRGVVVVEASRKSGSLITANLALEQGRELFAVPGNINRPQSAGTNELIKKGAKLVTGPEDILEELYLFADNSKQSKNVYPELTAEEEELIQILSQEGEILLEDLIKRSGKPPGVVNTILLKLELKGLVAKEAGKKYSFLGLQSLLKPL